MKPGEALLELYEGLKELSQTAFPKTCPSCGRSYASAEEFIRETRSVRAGVSGLKSTQDESDKTIIELFRNCLCGSTLMDRFIDRRDPAREGRRRRELFDKLMHMLRKNGVAHDVARAELGKVLRGEASAMLAALGIEIQTR
ncbi:MAG: oxidoreductase [Desulfobacteraceae bacterium]|nr:MAG: oxidoreductase [Desulfobacteraceae bacterium]